MTKQKQFKQLMTNIKHYKVMNYFKEIINFFFDQYRIIVITIFLQVDQDYPTVLLLEDIQIQK